MLALNLRATRSQDGLRGVVRTGLSALVGRQAILRLLGDPVDFVLVFGFVVRETVTELLVVDPVLPEGEVEHGEGRVTGHQVTCSRNKYGNS